MNESIANFKADTSLMLNFASSLRNSVSSLMLMQPSSSLTIRVNTFWKIGQSTLRS